MRVQPSPAPHFALYPHPWTLLIVKAPCYGHHELQAKEGSYTYLLLPQANGCACVDFGCTHPIDGLF
jgi:hypothetical protein